MTLLFWPFVDGIFENFTFSVFVHYWLRMFWIWKQDVVSCGVWNWSSDEDQRSLHSLQPSCPLSKQHLVFLGSFLNTSVPHLAFCISGILFSSCCPEPSIQRAAIKCASGPWSDSSQFSPVVSFWWVPALHCVPHWGSFSDFLLWLPSFSTRAFHTLHLLVKAYRKELACECEFGWCLGLL